MKKEESPVPTAEELAAESKQIANANLAPQDSPQVPADTEPPKDEE